jgi:hypothetical protein
MNDKFEVFFAIGIKQGSMVYTTNTSLIFLDDSSLYMHQS